MLSKPNALVYLRRNNLFVTGKHVSPANLAIANDLLNFMEVVDNTKFIATCTDFFSSHGLEGKKVLVVLDQSIVFTKSIILSDANKEGTEAAVNKFIESIPFESGQRAFEQLETDSELELYATNSDLYRSITEALDQSKVRRIVAIIPSYAYKLPKDIKPAESVNQFMSNKEVRKIADFSTISPL
jgi:hypothetical protein